MKPFAKLYETELGQILVWSTTNGDYKPCIKYVFKSKDGHELTLSTNFNEDSDESFDRRDKAFEQVTEEQATNAVKTALKQMGLYLNKESK